MATNAEIDRNNVLRRQALARSQELRREALRAAWAAGDVALRRVLDGVRRVRPLRVA